MNCRRCSAPVIAVPRERDERVAIGPAKVDAEPLSALVPLDRAPQPVWENHPRLGWRVLDHLARHGYPVHAMHQCKTQVQGQHERQDR